MNSHRDVRVSVAGEGTGRASPNRQRVLYGTLLDSWVLETFHGGHKLVELALRLPILLLCYLKWEAVISAHEEGNPRTTFWEQGRCDVTYLILLLPLVTLLLQTCNLPLEVLCLHIDLSQPTNKACQRRDDRPLTYTRTCP